MGVQRFRTFEDARRAQWLDSGDARILDRMKHLAQLARIPPGPHGVFRFRTIEEAKARRWR